MLSSTTSRWTTGAPANAWTWPASSVTLRCSTNHSTDGTPHASCTGHSVHAWNECMVHHCCCCCLSHRPALMCSAFAGICAACSKTLQLSTSLCHHGTRRDAGNYGLPNSPPAWPGSSPSRLLGAELCSAARLLTRLTPTEPSVVMAHTWYRAGRPAVRPQTTESQTSTMTDDILAQRHARPITAATDPVGCWADVHNLVMR